MKDPYLTPGWPCEVWEQGIKPEFPPIYRFTKYSGTGFAIFENGIVLSCGDHCRPIGTEWDYAPEWANYSTVDFNGHMAFWAHKPVIDVDSWNFGEIWNTMECGICPDKTRYQGENWKTSLRMRPEWAKVSNIKNST